MSRLIDSADFCILKENLKCTGFKIEVFQITEKIVVFIKHDVLHFVNNIC